MIKVVNIKNGKGKGIEYIGRPSPLGNPFKGNRKQTIPKYRVWLNKQINGRNQKVIDELSRLKQIALEGDLYLGCWCAPLPCHGDVIKSCIEWCIAKGGAK